jgi:hypothetical protein
VLPTRIGLVASIPDSAEEMVDLMEKLAQEGGRALKQETDRSPNVKEELRRKE